MDRWWIDGTTVQGPGHGKGGPKPRKQGRGKRRNKGETEDAHLQSKCYKGEQGIHGNERLDCVSNVPHRRDTNEDPKPRGLESTGILHGT